MARLWDRVLARQLPLRYSEADYTGAQYVSTWDGAGRGREDSSAALVGVARKALKANGVVFAAQLIRQHLFSEARFCWQALTDGHTFGDTSLVLLEHPWPNADSGELLVRGQQDGSLGNAYIRKAVPDDGGRPVLVQLRPEHVVIISEEKTDTEGRRWRQPVGYAEVVPGGEREPQVYSVEECAHFSPIPDPEARWRGMSWLTPILREVRADDALTRYKEFHLENGAMPGLVVKYSVKLSDPTVDTLRKRIRAKYGGPENAGNVLVLDEGADLTVAGSTLEQLQFEAVTAAGERRVCAAAGPGMLEILGFQPGDYQAAIRKLADLWARPQWRMFCAALEHLVDAPAAEVEVPVRLWFDVGGIAALREGELNRAQSFLVKMQGVASGVAAGYTRDSVVKAADSNDLSLLKADPKAPPPGGGAGGQAQKLGAGAGPETQPPTGGPAGGLGGMRPPQGGRPQQLPGVGRPNLPNALPPGKGAGLPALPAGARGRGRVRAAANGSARRAEVNGHGEDDGDGFPWWTGWQG